MYSLIFFLNNPNKRSSNDWILTFIFLGKKRICFRYEEKIFYRLQTSALSSPFVDVMDDKQHSEQEGKEKNIE